MNERRFPGVQACHSSKTGSGSGAAWGGEPSLPNVGYDTIVLGAGVAGLTAAEAALSEGDSVLCLETFKEPGGNHRSRDIGPYTFDNGSIVFYEAFPLFKRFPGVRETCVSFPHTFQRVAPGGRVRAYPFESSEALAGGPLVALSNLASLARARLSLGPMENVEDFCVHALGRRLYERLGLRTYVERFYGVPATDLEVRFAHSRMEVIARATKLSAMLMRLARALGGRRGAKGDTFKHSDGLARPLSGFPVMYRVAQDGLKARGAEFQCGVRLDAVKPDGRGFIVRADGGDIRARRVITTLPVNQTLQLIGENPRPLLEPSDLLTLYVSFDGTRAFAAPILYNFDPGGRWKRLTMHSVAYGLREGREYFNVEVPKLRATAAEGPAEFAAFSAHVKGAGAFRGDLKLEGCDVTQGAYPTFMIGSGVELEQAMARIETLGLIAVGRQGRFDYLPTTWHVMNQVDEQLARAKTRMAVAV